MDNTKFNTNLLSWQYDFAFEHYLTPRYTVTPGKSREKFVTLLPNHQNFHSRFDFPNSFMRVIQNNQNCCIYGI